MGLSGRLNFVSMGQRTYSWSPSGVYMPAGPRMTYSYVGTEEPPSTSPPSSAGVPYGPGGPYALLGPQRAGLLTALPLLLSMDN
ncbi:hypothetical protein PG985_010123 [Apiospora marii]|uniref:Uncharacterized protein n=1 Tax=Apiospora marii TaxID=335849 RepID=A0ABR1RM25_9PEZI